MHQKKYKYLDFLTVISITVLLVSNVSSGKIITLGPFTVSVVVLFWPFTYVLGDIFTEVYGYKKGRSLVWKSILCSVVAGALYLIVLLVPPASGFDANEAYNRVLGTTPRIIIGGWIAVFVGGFLNDYTLARMKLWTNGRHLWTRTIGSTLIGEAGDTIAFYPIAFWGILPDKLVLSAMIGGWIIKVFVEVIFTPFTYLIVNALKQLENEDYYDHTTNFNPFGFEKNED